VREGQLQGPGAVVGAAKIGSGTSYLDVCSDFCEAGREIPTSKAAGAQIKCTSTGSWDAKPTCALQDCGQPAAAVANGRISSTITTFNATATVSCDANH